MKEWPAITFSTSWYNHEHSDDAAIGLSHSAPSSCTLFSSSCRRAASFPLAHAAGLPSALKVRSQSESAALNKISIKVPRSILNEIKMYRQQNQMFGRDKFFAPIKDGVHSDSEGDDSLVSSDGDSSSSFEQDVDDHIDLGVGDLELDDCNHTSDYSSSVCYFTPQQRKKAVRFADDCGGCLETVRVMTEPSDYPPRISPSVIRRYKQAASESGNVADDEDEDAGRPKSTWRMTFTQPASEYVKFRETLENGKVALENVMLKNEAGKMLGTVKVANISYEKKVYIRFTCDGWKSYMDRPAVYQSSASKTYDTFRFEIEIPRNDSKHSRFEFCVCYATSDGEYWDSNDGKNYVLTSPDSPPQQPQAPAVPQKSVDTDDAYRLDYNNWTTFASWKSLSTDGPYW
jgi:protein phosphatase 1 regulatory subunit 3A/B/C/D/E